MKIFVYIVAGALLVSCSNSRKHSPYDRAEVHRGADSIRAASFIMAARESGIPSYYQPDRREIVAQVDTSTMTGSVDSFAARLHDLAIEQGVNTRRCIILDYKTKDTLAIHE